MVRVQHSHIRRLHNGNIHRIEIDGRKCHILEAHELTVPILLCLSAEGQVLSTDSVAALDIKTRLVGCEHALLQNAGILTLRNDAPADAVRSLMDSG